jgi:hypothetical protein
VRHWIDESRKMGLEIEAQDLVVRCYALWSRRTFELHGKPYEAKSPLSADATLEKPELPDQTEWVLALGKASQCLGITFAARFLSPENLGRFRGLVTDKIEKSAGSCADAPVLLTRRNAGLGLGAETDRLTTARSADQLCVALRGKAGVEQVRALAGYEPKTGGTAVGQHVARASVLGDLLRDDILFGVFDQLRARSNEVAGAAELVEQACAALRQDEVNVALGDRLRDLARQAQRLLHPETKPPAQQVLMQARAQARGAAAIRGKMTEIMAEVERTLSEADGDVELVANVQLTKRP